MKKTAYNILMASLLLAMAFLFSCTGDDEVMLDRVISLEGSISSSSSHIASSSSATGSSSSEEDAVSSSSEDDVVSSSSSEGVSSSSSEGVSSSSSDAASSSSSEDISSSSSSLGSSSSGETIAHGGQTYSTVKIGEQTWMAENLNYSASSGSMCFENLESNCEQYGRLYTWAAAMESCPDGWHIPSVAEWDQLARYADGSTGTNSPYTSPSAGGKLKAKTGWTSGNGTDEFGFEALPGGECNAAGNNFNNLRSVGKWWSSTEGSRRSMLSTNASLSLDTNALLNGYYYSARCIKGE